MLKYSVKERERELCNIMVHCCLGRNHRQKVFGQEKTQSRISFQIKAACWFIQQQWLQEYRRMLETSNIQHIFIVNMNKLPLPPFPILPIKFNTQSVPFSLNGYVYGLPIPEGQLDLLSLFLFSSLLLSGYFRGTG